MRATGAKGGPGLTITEQLRHIRQNWLILLSCTAFAGLVGGAYTATRTPTYQARAQLFVSISRSAGVSDLTQGGLFTQQRVKSYADLVSTPYVMQPVIDTLHLPYTADELADRVHASSHLDTVMLEVLVDDADAARSRDIANTIISLLPTVIGELETPHGEASSPVKIKAVRSATLPRSPVSPRWAFNLPIAMLVGLSGALTLTLIRDALDRSVNTKEQAQATAKAPTLTAVADDAEAAKHQLITHDAFSPRAEAFRQLRTNIRFLSVDHRVSSMVVTSAVPHEGKSTTSANLAIALAQAGEQVILIDADLRRPTVADVFALSGGVGLTSVLLGDLDIDDAVQVWREDLPLRILTAGPLPPNPSELIGSARMAALIADLVERGVTVVLDSPPLLPVTDAALLARATDGALVVTRAGRTHTEQLAAACEALRITGAIVLGVVLNRVSRKKSSSGYYGSYEGYHSDPNKKADRAAAAPSPPSTLPWPAETAGGAVPVEQPVPATEPTSVHPPTPSVIQFATPAPETVTTHSQVHGTPVPATGDPLPPAVREIIAPGATASPTMHRPRGSARRAARAAESPLPDMVIDADNVTISPVGVNPMNWPSEWGDLPALINSPRVNGEVNGNGRHRN